jgi:hypothetical protein
VKQQKNLVTLGLSFGNLSHLSRRGPTSFVRRFLEEFEESSPVLVKTALSFFDCFLSTNISTRMDVSPHLHISMPHVEKLADFLMLLNQILFPDHDYCWKDWSEDGVI